MKTKKIIIGILVLGMLGAFVAYKMYNKPHVNVAEASTDISISAEKILADFSADEITANSKYLEKIIEVKGVVSELNIEKEKGNVSADNGAKNIGIKRVGRVHMQIAEVSITVGVGRSAQCQNLFVSR